ncbi:MAG: hypothetical protein NVSMB10_12640 [Steroidobacteraceae bacterium]
MPASFTTPMSKLASGSPGTRMVSTRRTPAASAAAAPAASKAAADTNEQIFARRFGTKVILLFNMSGTMAGIADQVLTRCGGRLVQQAG